MHWEIEDLYAAPAEWIPEILRQIETENEAKYGADGEGDPGFA
jgi:hypothetical protein